MPRRKEAPGRGAPRRTRRGGDDRKPAALMDIVVGAVRRLGALMGVSVTDIERCAVAEGDLPARAGARSILRLGLNRAVESGRLQRLPGGLFRLPGDAPDAVKGDEEAVKSLSGAESMEVVAGGGQDEEEEGVGVGVGVGEGEGESFGEEEEQLVHMPNDASYDRLPLQLQPFDQLPPEQLKAPRGEKRRRGRSPCEPVSGGGGGGGERSAAEHGRAACAALFKLSADVISVIAQTAAARLSGLTADDASASAGARDDADGDDDANAHDTPRKKKKKGGPDSSMDLLGDTQQVVGATGSALSEIAVAATRGAARVLEVSCDAADSVGGGGARGGATKEAIFRTFKEAAMDIVRAARAFGEALGGVSEEAVLDDDPDRPDSALSRDADNDADADADAQAPDKDCGVGGGGGAAPAPDGDGSRGAEDDALDVLDLCGDDDDDLDEDGDATRGLLISCDAPDDPSCIDAAPSPDMEDFLRNLLQDVRELTQRVGNRIN